MTKSVIKNKMTEEEFEKELEEKCFEFGQGGLYFKEHYLNFKESNNSIEDLAESILEEIEEQIEDLQEEIDSGSGDDDTEKELNAFTKMLDMSTDTLEDIILLAEGYFEYVDFESCPELMGYIVGILARNDEYQIAYDFIGLDNIETEVAWDS